MIAVAPKQGFYWMPAAMATELFQNKNQEAKLKVWLLAALHGKLISCLCLHNHWILFEVHVVHNTFKILLWDGLNVGILEEMSQFAQFCKTELAIKTMIIETKLVEEQQWPCTCGAIALLHLGHRLRSGEQMTMPKELPLYFQLRMLDGMEGSLYGLGPKSDLTQDEREVVWSLGELLQTKGVPEDCAEERARLAVAKIGLSKLQEALSSKNVWQSLKALGSAPKVNYLSG